MQIAKYLSLASIMATVAWFFWNPVGWSFEWEPVVVFLASLGAFIGCDWKDHSGAHNAKSEEVAAHPSDVFLFKQLIELLPSTGVIHFLKAHDFLGSFKRDSIRPVEQFLYEWVHLPHFNRHASITPPKEKTDACDQDSTKTGTDLFFETCGRLHTAIREDASMNLAAIDSFSPPGPSPVYRDRFQPS